MNNRELRRRLEAAGFTLEHGGSHIKVKQGKQLITTISMGAHSVGGTKKERNIIADIRRRTGVDLRQR